MTGLLLTTLATHGLLVLTGLGLMQLVCRHKCIMVWACVPFAWGLGCGVVHLVAKVLLNSTWAENWHGSTTAACLAITILGIYFYWKAEERDTSQLDIVESRMSWLHVVLILLIVGKILLVASIAMVYPVFDSDATTPHSYTSLSKYIILGDLDAMETKPDNFSVSYHVPLLNAWLGGFWDRWHDSLAALSWFFYYFFIIYGVLVVCLLFNRRLITALIGAYLFSTVPLVIHHVVRPGFHDLPTAYFFMCGVAAVLFYFFDCKKDWPRATAPLLLFASVILMPGVKLEGAVWAMWLVFVAGSFYVLQRQWIGWGKLVLVQLLFIAVVYLVYILSADFVLQNVQLSSRLEYLFEIKPFDFNVFSVFINTVFYDSSFRVWWWLTMALAVGLVLTRKDVFTSLAGVYVLVLLLAVFYHSNFTGNVKYTLINTNVPRFFIQLHTLFLLVYVLFARHLEGVFDRKSEQTRHGT